MLGTFLLLIDAKNSENQSTSKQLNSQDASLVKTIVDRLMPEIQKRFDIGEENLKHGIAVAVAGDLSHEIANFKKDCHSRVQDAIKELIKIEKRHLTMLDDIQHLTVANSDKKKGYLGL